MVYPGTCRGLTAEQAAERARRTGRAPALRLWVPEEEITFTDGHMGEYREWLPADCGDFLLRRSDGIFAYQLAVVVDDAAMGVTEVVRGADLLASTPRQLLLYRLLGLEAPAFYHFPLLLGSDGQRLSKRNADAGLDTLGERYTAPEILGKLAYLAGFNPSAEPRSGESLLEDFAWEKDCPCFRLYRAASSTYLPSSALRASENFFAFIKTPLFLPDIVSASFGSGPAGRRYFFRSARQARRCPGSCQKTSSAA